MSYNQEGREFLYTHDEMCAFKKSDVNLAEFNEQYQITRDAPHFWYMQKVGIFGMVATVLTVHISSNGFKYDLALPPINGKTGYRLYNVHQDLIVNN